MSAPVPLPPNMSMTTIRGRYGTWSADTVPLFIPFQGMQVRFAPAYPFITNVTATPSPLTIATSPRSFQTDAAGYLSDPAAGFDTNGMGLNRNCLLISSDDPDINPHDWLYLVTFHGPGATNFRSFRTPAMSGAIVDIAVLTPQRVAPGTAPTQAEIAAADAAASAASAQAAAAGIRRGQAGGVAPLDADGDVNDADGNKILGGVGTGGTPDLTNITGMSNIGKQLVSTLIGGSPASASLMRGILGAGTGNSNVAIGTTAGTAADAATTNTAIGQRPLDAAVVHRTGDEPISGLKQFTDPMTIVAATASNNPVTKAQLDALANIVDHKVDLNPMGLVDEADIDAAIARKTDLTTALSGVTHPVWSDISGAPASGGAGRIYIDLPCPGDVLRPRTDAGSIPSGYAVNWVKLTPPPFGGNYMLDIDTYERANV